MRRTAIVGFVGVFLLLLFAGGSAATSAAAKTSWRVTKAVLPANAGTGESPYGQNVSIESISCASAGNCGAVGAYEARSGGGEALLLTERAGRWRAGVAAALPSNTRANPGPGVSLTSISCASAGDCAAVGWYVDSSTGVQGLLLTEKAGRWRTAVEATLPGNAASSYEFVSLNSVSCASAGDCSAVGSYTDNSDVSHGLLLTETGGAWEAGIEPTLPSNADTTGGVGLSSISCSSIGNCSAVGTYETSSGEEGLLLTEKAGTWETGVEAILPKNAVAGKLVSLNSVSCASAGNCGAVGTYNDTPPTSDSSSNDVVLLTETAGTWQTGVKAALPADSVPEDSDAHNPDVTSVSCASVGNCVAVGEYVRRGVSIQGLLLREKAGKWRTGVEAVLPVDIVGPPGLLDVSLSSVSCASPGNCIAVGNYTGFVSGGRGLLFTETAGRWHTGVVEPSIPNVNAALTAISCPAALRCSAAGVYGSLPLGFLLDSFPEPCVVPKVKGKTLRAAKRSIHSHACSVGAISHAASPQIERNHVIAQNPKPGRRLKQGARVSLVVSAGP